MERDGERKREEEAEEDEGRVSVKENNIYCTGREPSGVTKISEITERGQGGREKKKGEMGRSKVKVTPNEGEEMEMQEGQI